MEWACALVKRELSTTSVLSMNSERSRNVQVELTGYDDHLANPQSQSVIPYSRTCTASIRLRHG